MCFVIPANAGISFLFVGRTRGFAQKCNGYGNVTIDVESIKNCHHEISDKHNVFVGANNHSSKNLSGSM